MKKKISLLLVLAMLLSLLAACGSSSETTTESEETTETTETEGTTSDEESDAEEADDTADAEDTEASESSEEAASDDEAESGDESGSDLPGGTTTISMPLTEDEATIAFFMRYNPQVQDYVQDMSDNLFYQTLEELSGVTVDFQLYHPSVVEEQFNLQIASGSYCDIYCEYGAGYAGGLEGAVEDDVLLDLSDLIEEYMPNYYSYLEEDDQSMRDATTDSGMFVAVYQIYEPYAPAKNGPMIRADWAEEFGMDVESICTYEDYETYIENAYNAYGATVYLTETGAPSFNYLISGFGVSYTDDDIPLAQKDGTVFCTLLDDGMKDYLTMVAEWYANGWIYQDFYSVDTSMGGGGDSGMITSGETSMWWGERDYISQYENDTSIEGFKIAGIQDAVKEEGDETHFAQTNYDRVDSAAYIVLSTACEEPEIVLQWLDYRFTQDGYLLANYGIEGLTYEFDENGEPQYTDMIINNEEGMTTTLAQWRYMLQNTVCLTSVDSQTQGLTDYQLSVSDIWMANKDNEWGLPNGVALNAEEETEHNAISSDIMTYVSARYLELITGAASIEDDYDDFVDTLISMGIEDCVEIYQGALDRYYSK